MASASRADTISVSFVSHVGNVYTYAATLSASGVAAPGDGFTIFDFALPTLELASNSGWTASVQNTGSPITGGTPSVTTLGATLSPGGDDPSVANVTFQRSVGSPTLTGAQTLGTFAVTTSALFTGFDEAVSKDSGSDLANAFGPVPVAAIAPLPATANMGLVLLGGLGGLGAFRRLKNSKTVEA